MALRKDEGIVLFKRAYGESDRIVRIFTLTSGKVAAIAKGANKSRKRFMNTLEPFSHIAVEYFDKHGAGMVRIENAHIIETNQGIERSLKQACVAGFLTEFVDRLTKEREGNPSLFSLLKAALSGIKRVDFTYSDVLYYELSMLEALGYMPNFTSCVYCSKPMAEDQRICFSSERGGILCSKCSRFIAHKTYPEDVIPRLANIKDQRENGGLMAAESGRVYAPCGDNQGPVNNTFERLAREIMEGFVSFHLDVEFKSYRILNSLMR